MIGIFGGRRVLVWSLPGVCFLGFMIPLPFQLESLASQLLQWASAWCSCFMLGLTSTFAVTDGYVLKMATGRLEITSDCSGLRMTVAMAALGYVITFLGDGRCRRPQSSDAVWLERSWYLSMMMVLVIPAAVVANAARITTMAFVMQHYQAESFTGWTHDLGDWLVLPVSAAIFLTFKTWTDNAFRVWRTQRCQTSSDGQAFPAWGRWLSSLAPAIRIAAGPAALASLVAVSIGHYESQHDRFITQTMNAACRHEAKGDWSRAASCYCELLSLQPTSDEIRSKHARILCQSARSPEERRQACCQLEAVFERAPFHEAALRTHLDLALKLDREEAALRSAQRLRAMKGQDTATRQMCDEAMMRASSAAAELHAIVVDSFPNLVRSVGPVCQWRDSFLIELAAFCCRHKDSADSQLIEAIGGAITKAAGNIGSAEAHFETWRFQQVFGLRGASPDLALKCINEDCPKAVAHAIYLESAREAVLGNMPADSEQFLLKAIDEIPTDHRSYALLGDVYESQRKWTQCAAAYLRAWRLAGDRPLELGIKLSESLIRVERHSETTNLVTMLADQVEASFIPPSRILRTRLQFVQAELQVFAARQDMNAAKHDEAFQKLNGCHRFAALQRHQTAAAETLASTIETLQAQCLVRSGKHIAAARLFESRAGRADAPADQWTAAARAWRRADDISAAAHCYRNAVFLLGHSSEVWLEYVRFLKVTHGINEAVHEVVSKDNIDNREVTSADRIIAQAWEIVGDSDRAIEHYRSAASRDTRDVAALAIALARHARAEQAVHRIADERWAVSPPLRAHTAAMVGVSATDLSDNSRAAIMRIVEEGVAAASDDEALLLAAAEWSTKCQATSSAMEMLRRAVIVQPRNVVAANNLAMLLAVEGRDFELALEYIDSVLRQTGPVSEFLDTRGWILVQMNRAEEAIPWLIRAVDGAPSTDPVTQLHLATAYLISGERNQAHEHLLLAKTNQIRPEVLNVSEQRAWATLQKEFRQPALTRRDGEA